MALLLSLTAITLVVIRKDNHIAFVRSQDLVYGYDGMKEAHEKFKANTNQLQANLDTLKADYQRTVDNYNAEEWSEEEKQKQQTLLQKQEQNIRQYAKAIEQRMQEEDEKITQAVLNQINSFIEEYGKEKGYTLILGTTVSGNILYGNEAEDITDDLLKALNKNYAGQ